MHSDDEDYMPKVVDIRGTTARLTRERTVEDDSLLPAFNILTETKQQPSDEKPKDKPKEAAEDSDKMMAEIEIFKAQQSARERIRGGNVKERLKKERQDEIQKSKQLILEMQNKVNSNKFSEESYPVNQETVQTLIAKIDAEIQQLQIEADGKRDAEKSEFVKRELDSIQIAIKRCTTIKELYAEKISLKEKISKLEKNNIQLKEENTNLKFKIDIGIQKISDHMHNLPCEKEKELKEQLAKFDKDMRREKEMRMGLEASISQIVLNFKSLYDEVDTARLIIVDKLKELQEKERLISEAAKPRVGDRRSGDYETSLKSKKSMSVAYTDERTSKKEPAPGSESVPFK